MITPLLSVADLSVHFPGDPHPVEAVRGVSFEVQAGERVGIVGESGCGKTQTALALLRLTHRKANLRARRLELGGIDLLGRTEEELRKIRGRLASIVFQDPLSSLNPVVTIGRQLEDVIAAHQPHESRRGRIRRVIETLESVGIRDASQRLGAYPHEFSGGMRQRVMLAMALVNEPELLIADEPTSSLDVTVQAQVLALVERLSEERRMALILISHDLRVVASLCHRVIVYYAGQIVEDGSVESVLDKPQHPYTTLLLRSVPEASRGRRLAAIPGSPPSLSPPPPGCSFAPRCPHRFDACVDDPPLFETESGLVACWLRSSDPNKSSTRHLEETPR